MSRHTIKKHQQLDERQRRKRDCKEQRRRFASRPHHKLCRYIKPPGSQRDWVGLCLL
jgi:hypothetical protein